MGDSDEVGVVVNEIATRLCCRAVHVVGVDLKRREEERTP
jgi:hypothetical protein